MAKKILKLNLGDIIKTTGNKKLKKLSVLLNLIAPHIDITDDILNIYDDEGLATSYDILVDGVVKATLTRLARPEIGIEETYIKGAAIEGAKSYKLFKVANSQYTNLGEQSIGKQNDGFAKGYVDSAGVLVNDENIGWKRTDFIHIDQLADIGGVCVMLTPDTTSSTNYSVANFYTDNDASTFVGSLSYNDMNSVGFKAADVAYYAQTKNAKYVIFASRWQSVESLWVNLTNTIFFNLNDYTDIANGDTLVVKAVGNNIDSFDSNYSNEISYNTIPTLITFTIVSTSYQAEEGMTWADWIESEYNTGGYKLDVSVVKTSDGRSVLSNGSTVYATDTLNAGEVYTTGPHSGGAGTN